MSDSGESTNFLDFSPEAVAASNAALWAEMAVEEGKRGEAEKKQRIRRRRGSTGGGRGRPPGTDTSRSEKMVYRIVDLSSKTNWFVAGLGTTERMVNALTDSDSKLQVFTHSRNGDKMPQAQQYQLILNLTKKRGEPRIEWWPNKYTDKCHFVDNGTKLAGLYRVLRNPQIPGFVSVELVPTDERPGMQPTPVGLSGSCKWLQLEYEHLRWDVTTGKKVILYDLEPDQILGALEELLDVTVSEDTKRHALAHLAPVEEQDDSFYPEWARNQEWPKLEVIQQAPKSEDENLERVWDAVTYPFEDRQLNTEHW